MHTCTSKILILQFLYSNFFSGLKDDGFGEKSFFKCLVAETNQCNGSSSVDHEEKTLIGYATYYYGYSTWDGRLVYLEDLYVTPDHRGKIG